MKLSLAPLLFTLTIGTCLADVPDGMTYQGVLTDNAGDLIAPTTPTNQDIEFRIYSQPSGGTALWGEKQTVTVFKGNFSVVLGNGVTLGGGVPSGKPALADVFADGTGTTFFFGITPDGGAEFVPRQGILANAFAFRAKVAESVNGDTISTSAAGNVGIGIPVPQTSLHTDGTIYTEKSTLAGPSNGVVGGGGERIVLSPGNSTQPPYALGITGGTLWSSVPRNAKHSWYIERSEKMSLNATGLGIGTATPQKDLHVFSGADPTIKIQSNGTNEISGRVSMRQSNDTGYDMYYDGTSAVEALVFESFSGGASANKSLFLRHGSGNVGIGTNPSAKFHIRNSGTTTDTAWFQSFDRGPITSHIHNGANGDIYWRSAKNTGKVILQDTGGNVGIGTNSPTRGRLQIAGSVNYNHSGGYSILFRESGLQPLTAVGFGGPVAGNRTPFTGGAQNYAIWADQSVGAFAFMAHSDERIKEVKGLSDGAADLATLSEIKVTDYLLKDVVMHGKEPKKKVIAQQVEKVYPQAVSQTINVVPDIYKLVAIKDGWLELETDLKKGEKVRLVYGDNKDGIYEVSDVEKKRFRTTYEPPKDMKELFVFGREVDDFRTVDYEAISMLNDSATQEIYRQVTALKARVAELEAKDKARDAKMDAIETLLRSVTDAKPAGK